MKPSSGRTDNQRNNKFETIICPDEDKIEIPRSFIEEWKHELLKIQHARITTADKSSIISLCLTDKEGFIYSARMLAEVFGFQKPTKVILDYNISDDEFQMTVIATIDHSNRPTTFETIINPSERNIHIPIDFYQQWERELNRLSYGQIVCNDTSVPVYFQFKDTDKVMFGNDICYTFGLKKPTKVCLEYTITNNQFSLTFIESFDDQSNASTEVFEEGLNDDESDEGTIILDNVEEDEDSDEPQDDVQNLNNQEAVDADEEPIEWNKIVTTSMAKLSKNQVLHFPNALSRGVLSQATFLDLISEDIDFHYRCPIHTSEISQNMGAIEKFIGDGWYAYMLNQRPRPGDTFLFQLFPDTFELFVTLQRRN
ncbi:uncharacterized protein LOC123898483 isoform X1 [Trifolium pratense]|uniref:uncharacterized protein LOC123898483 isoform X1 n=1 Tax=Trifolium pratense TaxID=57577 RepID=UPI001E690908|nr:uncharacterized protein LOC123898483 isoform X1 [Trifolium pratense]